MLCRKAKTKANTVLELSAALAWTVLNIGFMHAMARTKAEHPKIAKQHLLCMCQPMIAKQHGFACIKLVLRLTDD